MGDTHLPRQVEMFEPYPESSYAEIDLTGLAAFAVRRLQELQIPTTFENLVVAVFKLFPTRFSLEGFPNYPDAARVGRTLLQLGPKYRNWARGSVQKGFVLTEAGANKAVNVARSLLAQEPITPTQRRGQARVQRPRTMDLSREIKVIEDSLLFKRWKTGNLDDAPSIEFFDLLGAYAYTPVAALKSRTRLLEQTAKELGRTDVLEFLRSVQRKFAEHLRE